jgi:hypothetical protein
MTALTNWHVDNLIKSYNKQFKKDVKYVDITKVIDKMDYYDSKTKQEDKYLLIECFISEFQEYNESEGNELNMMYVYISKKMFEECIVTEKPTMEIK